MSGDMVCVDKKQLTNFAGDLGEHMYFVSSADCQFWGDLVGQNHGTHMAWQPGCTSLGWGGQVRYAWAGSQTAEERVEWKGRKLEKQLVSRSKGWSSSKNPDCIEQKMSEQKIQAFLVTIVVDFSMIFWLTSQGGRVWYRNKKSWDFVLGDVNVAAAVFVRSLPPSVLIPKTQSPVFSLEETVTKGKTTKKEALFKWHDFQFKTILYYSFHVYVKETPGSFGVLFLLERDTVVQRTTATVGSCAMTETWRPILQQLITELERQSVRMRELEAQRLVDLSVSWRFFMGCQFFSGVGKVWNM